MTSNPRPNEASCDPFGSESAGSRSAREPRPQHEHTSESEVRERLKESAGAVGGRLKEQAERLAAKRGTQAGVLMSDIGSAVREAARCLEERDDPTVASWTNGLADRVESFAEDLQDGDPQRLTRSIAEFARRRPEISIASMFVAGLGIARFLKSSAQHIDRHQSSEDESPGDEGSNGQSPTRRFEHPFSSQDTGYPEDGYGLHSAMLGSRAKGAPDTHGGPPQSSFAPPSAQGGRP